jgi:hypothetical protein
MSRVMIFPLVGERISPWSAPRGRSATRYKPEKPLKSREKAESVPIVSLW